MKGSTDRSRFSGNKDMIFVRLRPKRVVEVKFDQMEGPRFRHSVTFLRWRPDRDPASCAAARWIDPRVTTSRTFSSTENPCANGSGARETALLSRGRFYSHGDGSTRSCRGGRTSPHLVQKTTQTPPLCSQVSVHGVLHAWQKAVTVLVL